MKTKPILFSTPMVQAILEGRKTMTRRVKGLEEININPDGWELVRYANGYAKFWLKGDALCERHIKSPYDIDDVLWVRETFAKNNDGTVDYKTDFPFTHPQGGWKPSIHMLKKDARIFLKVEKVSIERLHHISEEDIKKEGVLVGVNEGKTCFVLGHENSALSFMPDDKSKWNQYLIFKAHWAELWCKINGRKSWDLNPWLWVVEFERIEKPLNFI